MSSRKMILVFIEVMIIWLAKMSCFTVFHGHDIPVFSHSLNIREIISKKALACADPLLPQLEFDYDHQVLFIVHYITVWILIIRTLTISQTAKHLPTFLLEWLLVVRRC